MKTPEPVRCTGCNKHMDRSKPESCPCIKSKGYRILRPLSK